MQDRAHACDGDEVSEALRKALGSNGFLDCLPVGIYCCDPDGFIRQYNRRAADLWGQTPQIGSAEHRYGGAYRLYLTDGEPLSSDDTPMARVLRDGEAQHDQRMLIERRDGSRVAVLANIEPLRGDDGQIVGAVNCFQDISDLVRAEKRLSSSEQRLRDTLDALPVAVYTTDTQGRVTYFNEAATELAGRRPEIGSDRWCITSALFTTDGDPVPYERSPVAQTLEQQRPVEPHEMIVERPDGTRKRIVPYATPLFDPDGDLAGAVNLLLDVTERHEAQVESAHLAAIVSSSDDAVVSKMLDGTIRSWNAGAERIFGYTADEMVGQPITRIIPPELHEQEREILARLARGERIEHFDTIRIAKDGRRLAISLTVSPVRDGSGRIVGASKVARDVTERKRAEEVQKLLFDELNHRVKNTLATVQSIASQSLRMSSSSADFVTSFNGRVHALARAHDLLVQEKMKGADIGDIIRDQVMLGVPDGQRIDCGGPRVRLSARVAVQVALVLHELATNARKYGALSTPDGRLDISWRVDMHHGRQLRLDWKESGVRDIRAPQQRGFGTTLIERSLESSGGQADVHFGGDGLTCEISLPLPDETAHDAAVVEMTSGEERPVERHRSGDALEGKRILVVEDEPLVALEMEVELEGAGCVITGIASTLEAAKRMADEQTIDAALLDANLAGEPVDEVAAALTRKGVPFAFATGYGREALPASHHDAPLLSKPFSPEQLTAIVRGLIDGGDPDSGVVKLRSKI